MKIKNVKGITLIALIITIIIMLILAGVVLNLTIGENGIFNTAKYAVAKTKEETAREKLELALADLQARKYTDVENYDENGYINNYLINEGMSVEGNIVTVDGYKFEIDRNVPKIKGNLGQSEIILTKEVTKYLGKNANDKYEVQALVIIESKKEIEKVIIKKQDKITQEILPSENKQKIVKDITIELDEEYKATIKTIDGKTEEKTIIENSVETIKTKEELVAFGEKVNKGLTYEGKTVSLENDIDLKGSASNRNWKTIGDSSTTEYFAGTFEGNNHKIYNLYNKDTTEPRKGLFGAISGGTVQNLGIESGNIKGGWTSGGIAGRVDNGQIINCYNKAKIEGGDINNTGNIGGIVGYLNNSTIKECYNEGKIEGTSECNGGIVGSGIGKTKILSCYNIGSITGYSYVGGVAGYIDNSETILNNCYNKGDTTATYRYAGGIVGWDEAGTEVKNSYSIGTVVAPTGPGGVIGVHSGTLSNLFFINTAGPTYGCGVNYTDHGLEEPEGSTEATLKGLVSKFNQGQNPVPWKEDESNINDGYPILTWQEPPKTAEE